MKKTILALWLMCVLSIGATAQDAVLSALTDIKTDISAMKTDIAGIKTDVAVINTRLERLDVDVQSIFDIWVPLFLVAVGTIAVSYTHLTLPTICSV